MIRLDLHDQDLEILLTVDRDLVIDQVNYRLDPNSATAQHGHSGRAVEIDRIDREDQETAIDQG